MMRTIAAGLFGGPFSSSPPIPSPVDVRIPGLEPCGVSVLELEATIVEFDEEDKGMVNPKDGFPPLPLATGRESAEAPPPIPIPAI